MPHAPAAALDVEATLRTLAHGAGGALSVESTPGVGSTFTLHLPAAPEG